MSTSCAKCHRKFKGIYPLFLYWQEEEKRYLCRPCWGPTKDGKSPGSMASGYILVAVTMLLVLAVGLLYLHQDLQKQEWSQLDTTPVAELEEGELTRVEGVIQGDKDEIVLGGEERFLFEDSYYWAWDKKARFTVTDQDNNTMLVVTREYRHIKFGEHPAPNRDETDAKVYKDGDSVVMIGVLEKEDNETVFLLHWMGPAGSDPGPKWYMSGGANGVALVILLAILWDRVKKKLRHNRRTKYEDPVDFTRAWRQEKGELNWQENWNYQRGYLGFLLAFFLPSLLLGWAVFLQGGQMSFKEMERPLFMGLLASMAPAALVLGLDFKFKLFLRDGKNTPAWVAVSDRGIRLFSPHPEFADKELVEWEDIYPLAGSEENCEKLAWETEGLDPKEQVFDQLRPDLRKEITTEYLKRGKPGVERHRLKKQEDTERRAREDGELEERKRKAKEQKVNIKEEIEELGSLPDPWEED